LGHIWYDIDVERVCVLSTVTKLKWSTDVSRGKNYTVEDNASVVRTFVR
jgi:hypothetical protein